MYEGRRKSSRPNYERGILGEILFAIFERIYQSLIYLKKVFVAVWNLVK